MRDKWIVWTMLNDEQDAMADALGADCVSISGSTPDDERERLEEVWRETDVPVLITKVTLFGHGLNWQHCKNQVFVGVSHSFEQFYQAVRRSWRFGQLRQVDVHVVSSELEGRVVANLKDKQRKADELSNETRHYVAEYVGANIRSSGRDVLAYNPTKAIKWPTWLRTEAT